MSKIPAPKKAPKPKSIGGDSDLATPEHDILLQWAWENLESIVLRELNYRTDWLGEKTQEAIEQRKEALEEVEQQLRNYAAGRRDVIDIWNERSGMPQKERCSPALLTAAADRYRAVIDAFKAPAVPKDILTIEVESKQFQSPLSAHKAGRDEVVGFVDIRADIGIIKELVLTTGDGEFWSSSDLTDEFLQTLNPPAVFEWIGVPGSRKLYLDVRFTLPTAGVLVRDLRTLRELVGEAAMIALVGYDIPTPVAKILEHEGFIAIDRRDYPGKSNLRQQP